MGFIISLGCTGCSYYYTIWMLSGCAHAKLLFPAPIAAGIIRHILKNLESVGLVEKSTGEKGGRRLTASGQRDMDLIAGRCEVTLQQF